VRHRLPRCLILIDWLAATVSPSDVLQAFAWGRMCAGYSRTMPLKEAIELTFAPDHPCCLCKAIREAKQRQSPVTPADPKVQGKILLVFQPEPGVVIAAPSAPPWALGAQIGLSAERAAPPTPPPLA
jgi:hypothetical protein